MQHAHLKIVRQSNPSTINLRSKMSLVAWLNSVVNTIHTTHANMHGHMGFMRQKQSEIRLSYQRGDPHEILPQLSSAMCKWSQRSCHQARRKTYHQRPRQYRSSQHTSRDFLDGAQSPHARLLTLLCFCPTTTLQHSSFRATSDIPSRTSKQWIFQYPSFSFRHNGAQLLIPVFTSVCGSYDGLLQRLLQALFAKRQSTNVQNWTESRLCRSVMYKPGLENMSV